MEGVYSLDQSKEVDLKYKEGEVWLVVFWASYERTSWAVMKHYQQLVAKRGMEWNGKVRIIAMSAD